MTPKYRRLTSMVRVMSCSCLAYKQVAQYNASVKQHGEDTVEYQNSSQADRKTKLTAGNALHTH